MNSLDLAGIDWLGSGWLLLLAFTTAVLVVSALRRPCRRLFGAARAFQLWLLPPLAMLVSQLPHAAAAGGGAFPQLVYVITSVVGGQPSHVDGRVDVGWRTAVVLVWCLGIAATLLMALFAQWRYRRHLTDAVLMSAVSSPWPVLRAGTTHVGPALVGAWRTRIVLPADFEGRYDATEQMLILAHEVTHARRRDGWWCLLAQLVVAVFWFHPLAWWALTALRHDQELACDAAVLREHGNRRRSYANAMLKTQSTGLALPIGCPWSPRHPLTERIAMLKLPLPGRLSRTVGSVAGVALACLVAGVVYAASAPAGDRRGTSPASVTVNEYQLEMMLKLSTDGTHASHAERMTLALCMAPGKQGSVVTHGWKVDAMPLPEGKGQLRIDLAVSRVGGVRVAHAQLTGALGDSLHAEGHGDDGEHRYAIDITPRAGCPARTAEVGTGARLRLISQVAKNESVRTVAVAVAAKAGLLLVNPGMLDNRPVTLKFDQIPAERAMQLIADIDGMRAVFDDRRVRFEPK